MPAGLERLGGPHSALHQAVVVPMSVNARGAGAVRGSPFRAPWGIVFEGRLRQCFRERGGRVCGILKVLGVVKV